MEELLVAERLDHTARAEPLERDVPYACEPNLDSSLAHVLDEAFELLDAISSQSRARTRAGGSAASTSSRAESAKKRAFAYMSGASNRNTTRPGTPGS